MLTDNSFYKSEVSRRTHTFAGGGGDCINVLPVAADVIVSRRLCCHLFLFSLPQSDGSHREL